MSSASAQQQRFFISGHTDLPHSEFLEKYEAQIRDAAWADDGNTSFVVGDSCGVDTFAQELLHEMGVDHDRVLVYHIGEKPRNNTHKWPTCGGFKGHSQKDAAMTKDSTHDILYIRTQEESKAFYGESYYPRKSATQKNQERRAILPERIQDNVGRRTNA